MSDYDAWKRARLAELDAIDRQIDDLPLLIGSLVQVCANQYRRHVLDLDLGGHALSVGKWVEDRIRSLAAELDRITVAPVSDEQLRAMANEIEGK